MISEEYIVSRNKHNLILRSLKKSNIEQRTEKQNVNKSNQKETKLEREKLSQINLMTLDWIKNVL